MADGRITAEGLVKTYGEQRALDGFDLVVPEGTVCGLLGPNGAGKTTAVRILTTLLRARRGARGRRRGATWPAQAAATCAAASACQRPGAGGRRDPVSGRQNLVLFGRLNRLDRAAAARARRRAARPARAHRRRPTRPVKHYSGGMRRRLDLAVTLLLEPAVLFLDEPTTGLDPRNRNEVWSAIRRSWRAARPCCSPRSTSTRPTSWPTRSWSWTAAGSIAEGIARRAQGRGRRRPPRGRGGAPRRPDGRQRDRRGGSARADPEVDGRGATVSACRSPTGSPR